MSTIGGNDEHERVVRSLYDDVWTGRRYEIADALIHPEFAYAGAPGLKGPEAKLGAIRAYHAAVPDLRVTIDDLVLSDDRAAVRFTFAGTDSGGMRGRQPSGREISVWGVDMLGFRDGMIVSNWIGVDWLGLFVQIGAVDDPWA
jgi:predicted ester cyclase